MVNATNISSLSVTRQLWSAAGLPRAVLSNTVNAGRLSLPNDPGYGVQSIRSSFLISAAAQASIAATALAQSYYEALQDFATQNREATREELDRWIDQLILPAVVVDARHAVLEYKGWTRVYTSDHLADTHTDRETIMKESLASSDSRSKQGLGIPADAVAEWDCLAGVYRTKPGEADAKTLDKVRIHTNFPHHKLGIMQLLSLAPPDLHWKDKEASSILRASSREKVQDQLLNWTAEAFEAAAHKQKLCVTAYRSDTQWNESAMGQAIKSWMKQNDGAPFRISRLAHSANPKLTESKPIEKRPLRVVEMSRVIAGPVATRTLAAHGARVLLLSSPDLPHLPITELDTARGKRTAFAEVKDTHHNKELLNLLRDCDIFSQAYRPHGLAEKGLSADDLQKLRPGIVYLELRAFGFTGPWSGVRGFDSLTQTAAGFNYLEGLSFDTFVGQQEQTEPKALPVQALDYTAGFLMSFTALACKCRGLLKTLQRCETAAQGWHVEISLASTAAWIKGLGRVHGSEAWQQPPEDIDGPDLAVLAPYIGIYKVRGLLSHAYVVAIRHAAIRDADGSECKEKFSVPGHLNVDPIAWW